MRQPVRKMRSNYRRCWRDYSRDIANLGFLSAYIGLLYGHIFFGALIMIASELLLTPHSIKCRSATTMMLSLFFITISIVRIFTLGS